MPQQVKPVISVKAPISPGELTDKITILEIKLVKIKNAAKLRTVKHELKLLNKILAALLAKNKVVALRFKKLKANLRKTNIALWNIENVIRGLEAKKQFGTEFVAKARSVYITNDKRSEIKKDINSLFGSAINEVKQYTKYS